jgi:hypothetical protein
LQTLGRGWGVLLHAGDAYFFHDEMNVDSPECSLGLNILQKVMQTDGRARVENQNRLWVLKKDHRNEIDIFCAHDPVEFQKFKS